MAKNSGWAAHGASPNIFVQHIVPFSNVDSGIPRCFLTSRTEMWLCF